MIGRLFSIAVVSAVAAAAAPVETYDYIVVGSGPGGGPLACDLARAGYSTLLLEAGDDQGNNPTYYELGNFNTAGNDPLSRWDFWVKHSDDPSRDIKFAHNTWRLQNGSFYVGLDPPAGAKLLGIQYPRAGTLGGCAMHNGGVCLMPEDEDWELIANLTGDTSWNPKTMREYLLKIENNQYASASDRDHGHNGKS